LFVFKWDRFLNIIVKWTLIIKEIVNKSTAWTNMKSKISSITIGLDRTLITRRSPSSTLSRKTNKTKKILRLTPIWILSSISPKCQRMTIFQISNESLLKNWTPDYKRSRISWKPSSKCSFKICTSILISNHFCFI